MTDCECGRGKVYRAFFTPRCKACQKEEFTLPPVPTERAQQIALNDKNVKYRTLLYS